MVSQSSIPTWVYDPESLGFLDVNDAAVRFYGYPRERFLAMTVLDIRSPEERQRMIDAVRERADLDDAATWRHWRADGAVLDVVTHGRRIPFEGIEAVVVVVIDRTDVLALRQTLSRTRMILDAIIDALPTGLFVKDMNDQGRYVIYNPAMAHVMGVEAHEVVGRTDLEVFGPAQGARFAGQDREIMDAGRQRTFEFESFRAKDGESRQMRAVKKPLPTPDGSPPRYLLGIAEDITERRRSADRIARLALYDFPTDLPNRVLFRQRLDGALKRQKRADAFAVIYLDLDFFKTINDSHGHQAGDTLLKQVALRLASGLRRGDVVARLGGDEFAVLAHLSSGEAEALVLAERILKGFEAAFALPDGVAHVNASIGVALSAAPGRQDGDALMRHADIALYAAKAEGRGLAKVYADRMSHSVETRRMLSEDLRLALARDEFDLDYQPLHGFARDGITGFEALIRWRHPALGLIPPADFIPIAEQTGLIVPIGEWVLRTACRQAARWPGRVKVAVNLSAVQFRKAGLMATIEAVLAEAGLAPQRLELEITETVLLSDSGDHLAILHSLRALGVRIAMDDFGTGYSSLSYLRAFPFDKIKMDRSFVADMGENDGSLAIVRAVTGLGSSLSITTTAEGVETAEQFARLKAEGFDEVQGHFIGRPMSAAKAAPLALAPGA